MAELGLESTESAQRVCSSDYYPMLPLRKALSVTCDTQWMAVAMVAIPFPFLQLPKKKTVYQQNYIWLNEGVPNVKKTALGAENVLDNHISQPESDCNYQQCLCSCQECLVNHLLIFMSVGLVPWAEPHFMTLHSRRRSTNPPGPTAVEGGGGRDCNITEHCCSEDR